VLVEEGMIVKEGQVLARLDGTNVRKSLDLAMAQLAAARSDLNETEVRLREAEIDLGRTAELHREKISSAAELDRTRAERDSLNARLESQRSQLEVASRQLAVWQQQLDDLVIRAPFAGVVVSKNAQPGEMISPVSAGGGFTRTGICTIVDMESLEVEVDVNESYINRVTAGQPVEAILDSYPDWRIPGKVIAIIPTADRQKATVRVRVGFDKLDPRILPQMGVKVAFQTGPESQARTAVRNIAIPKAALQQDGGRSIVWVVKEGRAERRAVTVDRSRADEAILSAGLSAGETIVIGGGSGLKEGDRIKESKKNE
jgi:RND family efflux transporter MFP subunit